MHDEKGEHGSRLEEYREISDEEMKEMYEKYISAANAIEAEVMPAAFANNQVTRERKPMLQWYVGPNDGHPSPKRMYLIACMFFAQITGESPVGNSFTQYGFPFNSVSAKRIFVDGKSTFSKWGVDWIMLQYTDKNRKKDVKLSALHPDDLAWHESNPLTDDEKSREWMIPANPYGHPKTLVDAEPEEVKYLQELAWKTVQEKAYYSQKAPPR